MRLSDISRLLAVLLSGCALLATASPPNQARPEPALRASRTQSMEPSKCADVTPTAGNVTLQDHAEQWA